MPITQDRLIGLIEVAERALNWDKMLREAVGDSTPAVIEANAALESGDIERAKTALRECLAHLYRAQNIVRDYPIPLHLYEKLIVEKAHFKATSRKNTLARDYKRRIRSGEQKSRAQVDEEIRREWDAAPPVGTHPIEPMPETTKALKNHSTLEGERFRESVGISEPKQQAPTSKSGYDKKILTSNRPSDEVLNAPPTKPGSSLL